MGESEPKLNTRKMLYINSSHREFNETLISRGGINNVIGCYMFHIDPN